MLGEADDDHVERDRWPAPARPSRPGRTSRDEVQRAAASGRAAGRPRGPRSVWISSVCDHDRLEHRVERDAEGLARGLDHQRLDDRQGDRQGDRESACRGPARDATSMMPESLAMLVLTTSMPTPRPDSSRRLSRGCEKPGRKIRLMASGRVACRAASSRADDAAATARVADPPPVHAAAVVLDLDDHAVALLEGRSARSCRPRGLPTREPLGRALDAVVDARCGSCASADR